MKSDLEFILKQVVSNNAQVKESEADIEIARGQLAQARAALFPKANALILAAPIFEERGNAIVSTSNLSKWGPFIKGGLEIAQPLYSFGMISSYNEAAKKQVEARTELAEVKRQEILQTAKEFYYGYLMASELEQLVKDLIEFLEEAVTKAEQKSGKKGSNIKSHDVYRLKTALDDLRQKRLLANQSRQTAERAVVWISGGAVQRVEKRPLVPEGLVQKSLDEYLALAKQKRPETRALAAGQEARSAFRDAKQSQSYPIIFLGALASYGWSPVRDKQASVFANDPFNSLQGGVGLGLKFDLEFARHSAEASEQQAELLKLQATESYAIPGIELQVKRAYWELEQAIEGLKIAEHRKEQGKKWFVSSAMGWSIGITPPKDLLEALEGHGLAKKNYIETVYALNMALARLSLAVGAEVSALQYR